jgi:anti-anti-sigma factor
MTPENRLSRASWLLQIALLAALYAAAAKLAQTVAIPPGNVTAVWPSSGIALAALLRFGPRVWPGILLGAIFSDAETLFTNRPPYVALATAIPIGIGASLEALAGAAASRRFGDPEDPLGRVRGVVVFSLISCLLCSLISAIIGASSMLLGGYIPRSMFLLTWWTWWQGDVLGSIVVAPLLLAWSRGGLSLAAVREALARPSRIAELLAFLAMAIAIAMVSFRSRHPIGFLLLPSLIWAAFRFGPRGATASLFGLSALAVARALGGSSQHGDSSAGGASLPGVLLVQAFIYTAAATTFSLLAVIAERKRAEAALVEHSRMLEVRVAERTGELGLEVEERKRAEAALADHNRALEARVAERTVELNRANEQLEVTVAERTAELREKLILIEEQQETLRELSTPVLQIWDGVLVLPLIGAIDPKRAAQIMEGSLAAIARHQARMLIIDITGAPFVDAEVANYLIRTARAARLLGVTSMLVGISPRVARVLVQSGADLSEVGSTYGTLQLGLREALRRMRYRVE